MKLVLKQLFIFLWLFPVLSFGQKIEGVPFIRNYSPNEYKASTDNWAIAQDKRGIMYFGNASGVLEYDGVSWRLIPVANNSLVRSIAIDSTGIIYVGAVGEFGFLEPDKKGAMSYHSLVDLLPPVEREFADVWKTYATSNGIYFQTFSKIIRVKNGTAKIWKPQTSFHFSYFLNNKFFVIEREKGLKLMGNDQLELVKGGDVFSAMRIYSMLPYSKNRVLIATREKGLFLMDTNASDSTFKFFPSPVNEDLIDDQVYAGAKLDGDRYAYATLKSGVFILKKDGRLAQVINKKNGLRDDVIKNVATDDQGDLWIALGNGVSHAEISAPIRSLNDAQGISGFIWDITRFKNKLYLASSLGVYENKGERFELQKGIASQTWAVKPVSFKKDTFLLAASEGGIYRVGSEDATLLQEGFGYFIYQSKIDRERIFVGMNDGLLSLRYDGARWINEDYISGVEKEIRSIAEDDNGDLWLGTPFDGLIRLHFFSGTFKDTLTTAWKKNYRIDAYDTLHGLPGSKYNIPYIFGKKLVIATISGLYEFDASKNKFRRSAFLPDQLQKHQVYRIAAKDTSYVCLVTVAPSGDKETGIAFRQSNNSYSWYTKPFQRVFEREFHAILPDEDGSVWLGGTDGLLHYDPLVKKDFFRPFRSFIRMVVSAEDSIFGGSFYEERNATRIVSSTQSAHLQPEISYSDNSMRFEFSTASFASEQNNLFSIYLQGFDSTWSKWSPKREKEYTNLKEGKYIFHVKAKNIYGAESVETTYQFIVLPPWYRTWWAYAGYALVFLGSVYLVIRLSIRRLVKQKEKLEGIVRERTAEVVQQKHLIEEKHKEITDSINYAERIQRSFLATKELLDENLKEYFVLFQPKDVVSGDFYWASRLKNGQFALVTADSTGHGVPGAIMSLLNITSIEKAIEHHTDPAEILTHARKIIIDRLKKDGSAEGGKDGMDCILTCFDVQKMEMSYAAANNPLWIVRNKEIMEYDPDKMPVGKHDRDNIPFTKHTVALQKGDVVYTATDGMPDQFGGPKGKKFMYKKLKELFISVSDLPMHEQKQRISEALNSWKGNLEQVDDVCVIGVRI